MLHLHVANRTESLAARLAGHLAEEGRDSGVFEPAQVIVPSAALARHLTLHLAQAQGICANVRFSYLARWLWERIAAAVPGVDAQSPFDPDVLSWRILQAFDDEDFTGEHPRLAAWLAEADPVMRFDLAGQVAHVFDEYLTYRPDWLQGWRIGAAPDLHAPASRAEAVAADQAWQAGLWRRLASQILGEPNQAPVHPGLALGAALERGTPGVLPRAAHLFALPTIAPMYLALLQQLGQHMELHLYALNPCREYWFEVVERRRLAWLGTRGQALYHEEGHRLLAAWGRQTQAHLGRLVDAAGDAIAEDACFEESGRATLLGRWQDAVLDLVEPGPGGLVAGPDDRSLEIHVAHSLTRELEVLQDRLLGLFGPGAIGTPPLRPGDVFVVLPDLEAAAPFIDAVFGAAPASRRLPYAITGRPRTAVNAPARALAGLLALVASRFTVTEVMGLLQQPVVARRLGLADEDLARMRDWLREAGVHWGLDAAHRASFDLPAEGRHTLADGLPRLFLAYALPDGAQAPFQGLLPAGRAEGTAAACLGVLAQFVQDLAAWRQRLAVPHRASEWPGLLAEALARFVAASEAELDDLRELHQALERMALQWARAGLEGPVAPGVVQAALVRALESDAPGGVPTGAITFSSMASLRGLPCRVLCVLGLNHGAFPRPARAAEFDLMALAPRPGDRQRREDDRNVFLDVLLGARDVVHLSYCGRSVRDNALLPPSVLIDELLDALVPALAPPGCGASERAQARARLVVEHPLQPFSQAAFDIDADPRLRSFDEGYAQALRGSLEAASAARGPAASPDVAEEEAAEDDAPPEAAAPFLARPLPEPGPPWREVPLERLVSFFLNPCRFLVEKRLGLELRRAQDELEDDEPTDLDVRGSSALAQRLLPGLLEGMEPDQARALALAAPDFPAGAFARRALERELAQLQDFAGRVRELCPSPLLPVHAATLEWTIDGQTWRLTGAFAELRAEGLVQARYGTLGARDLVRAWLPHLLLNAAPAQGVRAATRGVALDASWSLQPCADARDRLEALVRLYARGLREPLPFFPRASWAALEAGNGPDLAKAINSFRPPAANRARAWAEGEDVGVRLALRGRPDPFGAEASGDFIACARTVFDPLLACLHRE